MDFSTVELAPDDQRFQTDLGDFLAEHVTEDVRRRDRETGDNFDEAVHLALMDVLGTAGALPVDNPGATAATAATAAGALEHLYRLASPVAIYGGTVEVFRNMIAQHALGLGRPNYAPPVKC